MENCSTFNQLILMFSMLLRHTQVNKQKAKPNSVLQGTDGSSIEMSDSFPGNYTCHVENQVGQNAYEYEIIIHSPSIGADGSGVENAKHTLDEIADANFSIDSPQNVPTPKVSGSVPLVRIFTHCSKNVIELF